MRRKISLYIGGQKVDLDDQSFILFNYTMEDLSNPTIVKNSFSQQITLKGTPVNNRVFGNAFKLDRQIAYQGGEVGADFNPSLKTPFTIYNEMNEVLESGYVKLDSVSRKGADITYKISLYGGLGSFFYALSYDEDGNKRTLADLDYLGTGNSDGELNFHILAQTIQDAWDRLINPVGDATIWDVINFAPAYNGIPEGNFDPSKAVADPLDIGLQDSVTDGGVTYTTRSSYTIINLAQAHDEWAVKDLRSYLQRPVFSMKAFWNAISNPNNNGGYEVDASSVTDFLQMGAYADLWMTLPMITSLGTIKQETGSLIVTLSSSATTSNEVARYNVVGSVPAGTRITANLNPRLLFITSTTNNPLYLSASQTAGRTTTKRFNAIFIQAVAYASDNSVVGGSTIKTICPRGINPANMARSCGFTPTWNAGYERENIDEVTLYSGSTFQTPPIGFVVEAQNVAYYKLIVKVYSGTSIHIVGEQSDSVSYSGNGSTSTPKLYQNFSTSYNTSYTYVITGGSNTISYTTSDNLRSGALITKAMLLSTSHTPAEYMLSFCKLFGLYFTYNPATKKVTILKRDDLYIDETIDLTKRVDLSKGIDIKPLVFDSKWYEFALEGVGGAFLNTTESIRSTISSLKSYPVLTLWMP